MDKVKYSGKVSTEWVNLSLLKSVKFAEDCEVCAVGVLSGCNTSTRYQKNLLVCSELLYIVRTAQSECIIWRGTAIQVIKRKDQLFIGFQDWFH